ADELEDPERDLKRGIFLSGAFIVLCYIIGFLAVGSIMRWSDFPAEGITSLSALFIIMLELGRHLGGEWLGQVFMRFAGLGMFLSYLGAFIALSYAPLRQFITGTPSYFWPERFQRENENGVRIEALKVQAWVVCLFIAAKSIFTLINPEGAAALYELIITMTNVGMTLPYMFLIYAWYRYRNNPALGKDLIFFKSAGSVLLATIISLILVAFGNVFTVVAPFISGDISTGVWTIIGPLLFVVIAMRFRIKQEDAH
nr:glutamate/gamma-aminobutyrate family transporter YjeM [Aeromonas sp.]